MEYYSTKISPIINLRISSIDVGPQLQIERSTVVSSPILNVVNVSSFDPPYTILKPGILE